MKIILMLIFLINISLLAQVNMTVDIEIPVPQEIRNNIETLVAIVDQSPTQGGIRLYQGISYYNASQITTGIDTTFQGIVTNFGYQLAANGNWFTVGAFALDENGNEIEQIVGDKNYHLIGGVAPLQLLPTPTATDTTVAIRVRVIIQ